MATKQATKKTATKKTADDSNDSPLLDSANAAVKKLVESGKERGFVTYDEFNEALSSDTVTPDEIEDTMAMLNNMGIQLVEPEDSGDEDTAKPAKKDADGDDDENVGKSGDAKKAIEAAGETEDLGRTDDPVRMYLREMGSVELLSREGEIAIAKRIEAGREKMIGAICESPLTMRAIVIWRGALKDEELLLRDIIDLDATYAGPDAKKPDHSAKPPANDHQTKDGEKKDGKPEDDKKTAKDA